MLDTKSVITEFMSEFLSGQGLTSLVKWEPLREEIIGGNCHLYEIRLTNTTNDKFYNLALEVHDEEDVHMSTHDGSMPITPCELWRVIFLQDWLTLPEM